MNIQRTLEAKLRFLATQFAAVTACGQVVITGGTNLILR
jgi:hypothetical protein